MQTSAEIIEFPNVRVHGERLEKLPQDLYIPPHALEVFLEAFEGPLDLLLYLIRRQNLDILDIPVQRICEQYMEYIALMRELRLELAAEYLVMAAWLIEIKSRMLLPRPEPADEEGDDPRAELVRRLQEYERYKTVAESLDTLPRIGRDTHVVQAAPTGARPPPVAPPPPLRDLLLAFRDVMLRAELFASHQVQREPLSVRERMSRVLSALQGGEVAFVALFRPEEGRAGVVVTLLAVLELVRGALIEISAADPVTGPRVRVAGSGLAGAGEA